jgi:hypothetical protein
MVSDESFRLGSEEPAESMKALATAVVALVVAGSGGLLAILAVVAWTYGGESERRKVAGVSPA